MKKIIYTGLSLIAAAALALLIMGLFMDEVQYTATVRIQGTIEETWEVFADIDRRPEWLEGFERAEQRSGNPMEVGAESVHHFEGGSTYIETVLSVVEHSEVSTKIATDLFTGTVTTRFEDQGDAIRVQQHTLLRGETFFWRAILPLFKPLMQRQLIDSLDRLEDLIEELPARPEPATEIDAP